MKKETLSNYLIIGAFLAAYGAFQFAALEWWLSGALLVIAVALGGCAHWLAPFKRSRFNLKRLGDPPIVEPSHVSAQVRGSKEGG
jgi:hypothetical protein